MLSGVADGEEALVSSPRGELRARVSVDAGQPTGLVFAPFHGGPLRRPGGWINTLPARVLDPLSFQPELKHTVVRVEPAVRRYAIGGASLAREVVRRLVEPGVPAVIDSGGFRRAAGRGHARPRVS